MAHEEEPHFASGAGFSAEDVLRDGGLERSAVRLREPSLTSRGMKLLLGVGLLGVLATILIVAEWLRLMPKLPSLPAVPSDAAAAIKNYKDLAEIALDDSIRMFDTVVVKALLPVFTTILGYIFGSRSAHSEAA